MIAEAIEAMIVADVGITAQLATYDFGGLAVEPAVFTIDPIPHDSALPAIVITEQGGARWGTIDPRRGTQFAVGHVRVFDNKGRSRVLVRGIAQALWELLDLANLVVAGYNDVGTYADPPQDLPDSDGFPGSLVIVSVRLLEV